jgi:hypothetical protein
VRFDHESRGAAPLYAGRHRKGRLAAFGDWRRGYRPRTRSGRDAATAPLSLPPERELQVAGRHGGGQAR